MTNSIKEKKEKLKIRINAELELIRKIQDHLSSDPHKIEHAIIKKIDRITQTSHEYAQLAKEIKKQEQEAVWFFIWHPRLMDQKWAKAKGQIKRIDNAILNHHHREFNHIIRKNRTTNKILYGLGLKQSKGQSCNGVAISFPKEKKEIIKKYLRGLLGDDFYAREVEIILPEKGLIKGITLVNATHKKVFLDWAKDPEAYKKTAESFSDPLNKDKKGKSAKKYLEEIRDGLVFYGYPDDHVINMWTEVK